MRFMRVPFGKASSPFMLNATKKYHLEQEDTVLSREIRENIYADNVLHSAKDVKKAI